MASNGITPDSPLSRVVDARENAWMVGEEREPPYISPYDLVLTPANTIEPEVVHWLWYPYLPLGKLCLLGGDPGLGKTWIALAIAAAYSRGQWPFLDPSQPSEREPGQTLYCASEDGTADTLVPRLRTMGADLDRIIFLGGRKDKKGALHRVALNEENVLIDAIRQTHAKLIIFDPFQRFLPAKTKMNEMETVSPVVQSLMTIAEKSGCTVLLLGHLNKSKQDTLGYKFIGSVDWFAAARSVLMVIKNPDEPVVGRYLYQIKNSLAPQANGIGFSLAHGSAPFQWGDATSVSAEEMFTPSHGGDGGKGAKSTAAEMFLSQELADGEKLSEDLIEKAKELDISRRTLFSAKQHMGIKARKSGFSSHWYWYLPDSQPLS